MDDKPLATSAETIEDWHAYALEWGSTSIPSNSSGSKVYVVQVPPSPSTRKEVRRFTQTHPSQTHMCPRCLANGFGDSSVNAHVVASCPWIRGPSAVPARYPPGLLSLLLSNLRLLSKLWLLLFLRCFWSLLLPILLIQSTCAS